MRHVTNKEYVLPSSMVIVSTTDLEGIITHCNESFLQAAGMTRDEVMGQPHNILRHPDVPAQVFGDMWKALKSGMPWSQVVKNRRKNGDHYWVRAFATPIREQGRIVGYMSVRFPATRDEITGAARAYKLIHQGKLKLVQGRPDSLALRLKRVIKAESLVQIGGVGIVLSLIGGFVSSPGLVFPYLTASVVLAAIGWGWSSFRMNNETGSVRQKLAGLASGDVRQDFTLGSGSMLDKLSQWLQPAVVRLGWMAQEAKESKSKSDAVLQALDSATSCIMLADTDYHIRYVNQSLHKMLQVYESQMRDELPDFDSNQLIGANIDVFYKDPINTRKMLDSLTEKMVTELPINGLRFRLNITPILLEGERCSTMVEWEDITQEYYIQTQLQNVIQDLSRGHFKSLEVNQQATGFYRELQVGINGVIETLHNAMVDITQVVVAQSEGDLSQTIDTEYHGDLGRLTKAINASTHKLNEIVSLVRDVALHVDEEATEVSQDARELSSRVQEQASSLEETSATMHQMNSAVQNNSQNALETEKVAQQVESEISTSVETMQQTIDAMSEIQASSHQIAEIVTMIDSIAFQTNLLALNAAVEAARAGDHGRGFAVVAGEVRGLAQKSAEAAKDIRKLIDESVAKIDRGTQMATEAGASLNGVTESIHQVTKMVEQIAQASSEQADGIQQVHQAITNIDSVTQENAGLVERTTEAANNLSEQAHNLNHNMAFFKTDSSVGRVPLALNKPKKDV